jgi:NADPH2:quinone reductase
MARQGQVVVIGSRGTVEIDPRDMMSRELTVKGMMLAQATEAERAEAYTAIEKQLADGSLCPVIAQELPLDEAPQAHHAVMESAHHGKIILIP